MCGATVKKWKQRYVTISEGVSQAIARWPKLSKRSQRGTSPHFTTVWAYTA